MTDDQQPINSATDLTRRLNIEFALQAAGLGIWEYDPHSNQVLWDERCRALFGLAADNRMSYEQAFQYIHPDDVAQVDRAAQWVMNPQSDGVFDQTYRTIGVDDGRLRWVRFQGRVDFASTGQVQRFAGIAQEVTQQVTAYQQLAAANKESATINEELLASNAQLAQVHWQLDRNNARLANLISATPTATAVFTGRDMVIQQINAPMLTIWGKDSAVIGKTLHEAMPELEGQPFLAQLQHVFDTGEPFYYAEGMAEVVEQGQRKTVWFNHAYNPLYYSDGQIYGVINTVTDVTAQVLARRTVEESEAQFRSLIEEAPVATCLFVGRELRIEVINQAMIGLFGKGPTVLGKTLATALPELANQPLLGLLDEIFTGGEVYETRATPARIVVDGVPGTYYYDVTFKPLRNADGQVYAILQMSIDVTPQVLARQKIEESEARLQLLTNTVPAMIFSLDQQQRYQSYNNTFMDWFGVDTTQVLGQTVREFLGEAGYSAALPYLTTAYGGRPVRYQLEAPSRLRSTRWLDIVYSPLTNAAGEVTDLIVHATDITLLKQTELALTESESRFRSLAQSLEQQVQERTEALATANEELAATNEELAATNENMLVNNKALETSNTDLVRSNQNLEQFAYIASHDLQEPLRKIQQFGDLLQGQYGDTLGEGVVYLQRMQLAASRMSALIKDLLAFSRIATTQVNAHPVALNELIEQVLEDLSVAIKESGAQLTIDPLPTVQGDELQLKQLFQNLLSNALKFQRKATAGGSVTPQVTLRAQLIPKTELPPSVQPTRYATAYHRIEIIDNGIGFEEKYLDRIFQVFQRLHGKNEFAGTGVGLAIVQKVVTNHGGAITASSQPGQGATFSVYLPS